MNLLKDDVKKLFLKFLIPAISSAIAVAAYSLVDTIAIGQGVGADGTAACAVALPIFSIANFIALLCGIGGCVLRSQAKGEGNEEKGNAYFTSAVCLVAVITLAVWGTGNLIQNDFYRLCGADEVLMPYAKEYGAWIFACLPSFVITAFLGAFIRTDGSPKYVMCSTLIGGAVNIVGDWLFVFPLNMGMAGAAIATVLGSMTQAMFLLIYIILKKTSLKLVKPHHWIPAFKKIVMVGFGSGIGALSVIAVSFIANNQIMKYCGAPSLAVYGVLGTVSALFLSIFSGIGQAAQPIVSENYGAGNVNRYWKTEGLGMKTAVLFGILFTAVCVAFPTVVATSIDILSIERNVCLVIYSRCCVKIGGIHICMRELIILGSSFISFWIHSAIIAVTPRQNSLTAKSSSSVSVWRLYFLKYVIMYSSIKLK